MRLAADVYGEADRPPLVCWPGASIGGIASAIALGETPYAAARALILVDVVPEMDAQGLARIRAFMSAGGEGFASIEEAAAAVNRYRSERRSRRRHAIEAPDPAGAMVSGYWRHAHGGRRPERCIQQCCQQIHA